MKVLLDENLPVKLKYRFQDAGFNAFTVRDMQWLGKENGELLQLMQNANFTTFITIDDNLSFQQNFQNYPIQVTVLVAQDNTYDTIMGYFRLLLKIRRGVHWRTGCYSARLFGLTSLVWAACPCCSTRFLPLYPNNPINPYALQSDLSIFVR